MAKLSIITINRNNSEGLRKTIESVISQTYTDFEYIIIDGASTDESVEIIKEYSYKITYWVSEPDKGIYNAMNKGILKANGEYLQFLNSGDCFYNFQVLSTVFNEFFDEDFVYGDEIIEINAKQIKYSYPHKIDFGYLRRGGLPHQSTFIRRELFKGYLYKENYKVISDWEFVVENIVFRQKTYLKKDIIVSLFDGSGVSADSTLKMKEKWLVLKHKFNNNVLSDFKETDKLILKLQQPEYLLFESMIDGLQNKRLLKRVLKVMLFFKKIHLIK